MTKKTLSVYITSPCLISGEHVDVGSVLELDPNDAMALVGANRATLKIPSATELAAMAKKKTAKKVDAAPAGTTEEATPAE